MRNSQGGIFSGNYFLQGVGDLQENFLREEESWHDLKNNKILIFLK